MSKIVGIKSYKILNSRGDWTIRTEIELDTGIKAFQTVPEGASKGEKEAISLPVDKAVENVSKIFDKILKDKNPEEQKNIDEAMIDMDGTDTKYVLGGNAILSVSLAVAKAGALSAGMPLYKYLAGMYGYKLGKEFPSPVFNVLNGGKHAQNGLSFQEFMIIPSPKYNFEQRVEVGQKVYKNLKDKLHNDKYFTGVGDEGGFAPEGFDPEKALTYLRDSVSANYVPGEDVFFGMDVAADSFWNEGVYDLKELKKTFTKEQLAGFYEELLAKFEIIYLEDPYCEQDSEGWTYAAETLGKKVMIVGDDLVVTNPKYLEDALEKRLAKGFIVKPNQVGTLTETVDFIKTCQSQKAAVIFSHRSGDTAEDTFISDLAYAVGAEFIKSGAPARGERVSKYNRLLEIYHEVSEK